jgi:dihydroflavonol-4-reductase
MLRIAESGRSGERYILSGGFVEFADILAELASLTGAKPPKWRIPFSGAVVLATAVETWSRIRRTASPMSVEAIRLMNARRHLTSAKAEKELGVTFRPFAVTLADTMLWARTALNEESGPSASVLSPSKQETA